MKYKAESYQKAGIRFMLDHPRCGVFADPGGGKTAMSLAALTLAQRHGLARRALIIAPRLVCYDVWPAEVEKWDQFKHLKTSIIHGDQKAQTLFQEVIDPKADICLVNPEAVDYLFSFFPEQWFERKSPPVDFPWDWLIIDESSKFKNPGSVRFKTLKKYTPLFNRVSILTGTPIPNGIMDMWAQIYLLDGGGTLGKNITTYRKRYFDAERFGNQKFTNWVPKRDSHKIVQDKIAPFVIRFDESQFAELPEMVFNEMKITLPEKAMNYYESAERSLLGDLDSLATSASGKYLLCRQIANGRHYDPEDKTKIHKVHDVKIEVLKNLVGELQGKPLLVAYYFKHDLDAIRETFPKIPNIGSDTTTDQIVKNLADWNAGKLQIMAVHPASMSHGLNMQAGGSDLFYYSLTNSLEEFLQLNKRLHRRGAKSQVRIHLPIAKNTVDVAVMASLRSKTGTQKALLDALREYRDSKGPVDKFRIC